GTGTGGDWPDGGSGRGPAGSPASLRRVDAGSACGTLVGDKAELPAERPCSESGSHVREGERGRGLGHPHRQAQVSGFRRQGQTTANASSLEHSDKKMKIVIAEKVTANAVQLLRDEGGWTVVTHDQLANGLASALPDADALIVRSAVNVNAQVLRGASKLRVIGRAGVGVDNIDLEAATKAGIAVMNTPGANAVAVAEHTMALMLALARHLCRADATTRAGQWEKKSMQGTELRGKTLGIIGLGRIGMEVARRAKAFEMKVVTHDPFVAASVAREHGIALADLDQVYAEADYLTLHVGLTPQTAGMINEKSLARMKKGVRIINCARGELLDEAAVAAALASKQV